MADFCFEGYQIKIFWFIAECVWFVDALHICKNFFWRKELSLQEHRERLLKHPFTDKHTPNPQIQPTHTHTHTHTQRSKHRKINIVWGRKKLRDQMHISLSLSLSFSLQTLIIFMQTDPWVVRGAGGATHNTVCSVSHTSTPTPTLTHTHKWVGGWGGGAGRPTRKTR